MLIWDRIHCRWIEWRGSAAAWRALPHASVAGACAKGATLAVAGAAGGLGAAWAVDQWPIWLAAYAPPALPLAVSEPATVWLLGAAVVILAVALRK